MHKILIYIKNSLIAADVRIFAQTGKEMTFDEVIRMMDIYINRMIAYEKQVDR